MAMLYRKLPGVVLTLRKVAHEHVKEQFQSPAKRRPG
jgi:hypothetical protein